MDVRIKFLEQTLRYLQGQLTAQLFNRNTQAQAQTLVYQPNILDDEINHIIDRMRHYLVHLHTKCETTSDFIAYCKEVDNEFEDAGQEHLFCTEFDIPYTGKLDNSVLIHFKDGLSTRKKEITSLHVEKNRLYINGQKVEHEIRRFIFVDKAFELDKNDDEEFNELIVHFKNLQERIKLQNIGDDFK